MRLSKKPNQSLKMAQWLAALAAVLGVLGLVPYAYTAAYMALNLPF